MAGPASHSVLAWLQEGAARHQSGDLKGAERSYDKVLKADPSNPDALNLKGLVASDTGRHRHALSFFERAARALPDFPDPHFNKGLALSALGRNSEALEAYAHAILLKPAYGDACLNLGLLLFKIGRADDATAAFRVMTKNCPMDARGFYNLGACLEKSLPTLAAERRDAAARESEVAFERALALDPGNPDIHYAFSNLKSFRGAYQEAVAHLETALRLRPHWPDASNNLANQVEALGDRARALAIFDRAIEQDPANTGAVVNRGMTCLALGRLAEGWQGYARRFDDPRFPFVPRAWPWPKWQGEDLAGKSILLWGDQGVGDEILYGSMIHEIAARAGTCVVECEPRLVALYKRSFPTLEVVTDRGRPGKSTLTERTFDFQCSVLDLGAHLRRSFAAFRNHRGFMQADAAAVARLRQRYLASGADKRLIGLSWRSSNPGMGHQKSLALTDLLPLLEQAGVTFLNLQYGDVEQEITALRAVHGIEVLRDGAIDPLTDLDAFAAQVYTCDAVVTVSNTTAHFAGALDVPTVLYVPNGRKRHWYWFDQGHHSPWYRTVRIVRTPDTMAVRDAAAAFFGGIAKKSTAD